MRSKWSLSSCEQVHGSVCDVTSVRKTIEFCTLRVSVKEGCRKKSQGKDQAEGSVLNVGTF